MTVLITGISGLLGLNLCNKLVNNKVDIVGLVHLKLNPTLMPLYNSHSLKLWQSDIQDINELDKLFSTYNITSIFHTVAHMPYTPNADYNGVNIIGTNNLLKLAKKHNVSDFMFSSSLSVYSLPLKYLPVDENHPTHNLTEYGRSKLHGELDCLCYSDFMRILIMRYAGIYGKGMDANRAISQFIINARNNQPIILDGDGNHARDFVYVEDVAQGMFDAWKSKAQGIYNLGSGQSTKMRYLAEEIKRLTNSKSKILTSHKNNDQSFDYVLDISKAKRAFGFSPRSFQDGLQEYIKELI